MKVLALALVLGECSLTVLAGACLPRGPVVVKEKAVLGHASQDVVGLPRFFVGDRPSGGIDCNPRPQKEPKQTCSEHESRLGPLMACGMADMADDAGNISEAGALNVIVCCSLARRS